MSENEPVLTGTHFINGDIACAEGALAAGCTFFGGYPITPATEIAERMSERLPLIGGVFIQMEDEIASMAAILGASWGGKKSMTSTSGPGFSLMMENIGLGIMTETPCVVVDVQRGGPSTGLPTLVAQADMMQARWGSHGTYEIIALCPNSPQEMFDLTIQAFNFAEKYRLPVLVMADEVIAHMTGKVVIPPASQIKLYPRRHTKLPPGEYIPYKPEKDLVPDMVNAGEGYYIHITGLTHEENGYPKIDAATQQKSVQRLVDKIVVNRKDILMYEEKYLEDAEIVVCAYGITSRIAMRPIEQARKEGIKVGMFRLITAWPFPEEEIREIAGRVKAFIVPELNAGQMVREVERAVAGKAKVTLLPHMGGEPHNPDTILEAIKKAVK
ncbi:MAG: 2-oxoacid:acceptor oxidoreductase subunit alpha [Planctomycetes bacterium]|nr:2-oxoacid:acceptor oxidoreductase subunit alpha [Planctomycetota bacterium]